MPFQTNNVALHAKHVPNNFLLPFAGIVDVTVLNPDEEQGYCKFKAHFGGINYGMPVSRANQSESVNENHGKCESDHVKYR